MRFRRARGAERQQLKWLLYAVLTVILGCPLLVAGDDRSGVQLRTRRGCFGVAAALLLVPLAVGLAILRYRLYDIDRLINRTLVYGLLTVLLGLASMPAGSLVFVLVFGGTGADPPSWLVAAATLAAAAICSARLGGVSRPRWIGASTAASTTAAQTIQAFSTRLRDQIDLDTLVHRAAGGR